MAGIKDLVAKVKIDEEFAKSLKEVRSFDDLMEKVKEAGFEVTIEDLKDALGDKGLIPEGILDKLPDSIDLGGILGDALESDVVKKGLGKLGKFF